MDKKTKKIIIGLLVVIIISIFIYLNLFPKPIKNIEVIQDKENIALTDTIKFECIVKSNSPIEFKWLFYQKLDKVDPYTIIDSDNYKDAKGYHEWVKFKPSEVGDWNLIVIVYTKQAKHKKLDLSTKEVINLYYQDIDGRIQIKNIMGDESAIKIYNYKPHSYETSEVFLLDSSEKGRLWDMQTLELYVSF